MKIIARLPENVAATPFSVSLFIVSCIIRPARSTGRLRVMQAEAEACASGRA